MWPPLHVFTQPLTAQTTPTDTPSPAPESANMRARVCQKTSNKDLREYVSSKRNPKTVRKTDNNWQRFKDWMIKNRNETRHVVYIEPGTLDQYVGSFILDIRKADGGEYEPDLLTSFHRSINRKLEEFGYPYSLVDSKELKLSKKVLESKHRELRQKGMGNRKKFCSGYRR